MHVWYKSRRAKCTPNVEKFFASLVNLEIDSLRYISVKPGGKSDSLFYTRRAPMDICYKGFYYLFMSWFVAIIARRLGFMKNKPTAPTVQDKNSTVHLLLLLFPVFFFFFSFNFVLFVLNFCVDFCCLLCIYHSNDVKIARTFVIRFFEGLKMLTF